MNILHYSLGIYPDRQGGLVRYSTDLAVEQSKENTVYYLFPGKLGIIDKKVRIVKGNTYKDLKVFKIENALPISLYGGIKDVELYTRKVDRGIYEKFFIDQKIDIVHIHSLMGLHIEFIKAAKELKIPVLMTTHDFFGLCPITTLYKNGQVCEEKHIGENCLECSKNAHSYIKLAVGQSQLYKKLKSTSLVSSMRKHALLREPVKELENNRTEAITGCPDYENLDHYYKECFLLIDYYLFNSNQTKEVYESRLGKLPGETIPLLLPTITDKRKKRDFLKDGYLHVGFMGEPTEFKGFFVLKTAVEELVQEGYKAELDVYNDNVIEEGCVKKKGKYTADDLDRIYDSLDIVAVPSICYETLSFTALEAIASGMPCMVSDHVGAKDFITDGITGYVSKSSDISSIKECIHRAGICSKSLNIINENICQYDYSFGFKNHASLVYLKYLDSKRK